MAERMSANAFNMMFKEEKTRRRQYFDRHGKFMVYGPEEVDPGAVEIVSAIHDNDHMISLSSGGGKVHRYEDQENEFERMHSSLDPRARNEYRHLKKPGEAIFTPGHLTVLFDHSPHAEDVIRKIERLQKEYPYMMVRRFTDPKQLEQHKIWKKSPIELTGRSISRVMHIVFHEMGADPEGRRPIINRMGKIKRGRRMEGGAAEQYHTEQLRAKDALLAVLLGKYNPTGKAPKVKKSEKIKKGPKHK